MKIVQVINHGTRYQDVYCDNGTMIQLSNKCIGACRVGDSIEFTITRTPKKVKMWKWLLRFPDGRIIHTSEFKQFLQDAWLEAERFSGVSVTVIGPDENTMIEVEE